VLSFMFDGHMIIVPGLQGKRDVLINVYIV
jgi:hypothetical protein